MGLYQDIWGRIPFITTLLICITPIFYIFCALYEEFFEAICNDNNTFMSFQIYRLITSGFAYPHAYSLGLTLILFYWESTELEKVIGSGTYFIHLFLKTILINTITWVYIVPIVLIFDIKGDHRDFGFFPVILSDILVRTYYRPEELRLKKVSNKIYALLTIILFIVVNIEYLPVNLLSVITYAFIEIKYFNGMALRFYKKTIQNIEDSLCTCFKNRNSFVKVQDCSDFLFKRDFNDTNVNTEHLQEMCEDPSFEKPNMDTVKMQDIQLEPNDSEYVQDQQNQQQQEVKQQQQDIENQQQINSQTTTQE